MQIKRCLVESVSNSIFTYEAIRDLIDVNKLNDIKEKLATTIKQLYPELSKEQIMEEIKSVIYDIQTSDAYTNWGLRGRKTSPFRTGMDSPLTESLNTSLLKFLLMAVTDGASVTETPRLKRGSMWYASAPFNSPIRGHSTLTPVLGVGATLGACGALPSTRSERLRARWDYEAGSPALQGGVAHVCYHDTLPLVIIQEILNTFS